MPVGLLLVSDSTLARIGLTATLRDNRDVALLGLAQSASEGRQATDDLHPDVTAVDVALPDCDALRFAAELRRTRPALGVVLVGPRDDERLMRALEAGISAYVPISAPIEVLLSAVRHAAVAPGSFTAPDVARALARRRQQQHLLSRRETEVLRLLYAGASVARIAEAMVVAESTVKTYLSRLYEKLGANNRGEALAAAGRAGLIPEQRGLA